MRTPGISGRLSSRLGTLHPRMGAAFDYPPYCETELRYFSSGGHLSMDSCGQSRHCATDLIHPSSEPNRYRRESISHCARLADGDRCHFLGDPP